MWVTTTRRIIRERNVRPKQQKQRGFPAAKEKQAPCTLPLRFHHQNTSQIPPLSLHSNFPDPNHHHPSPGPIPLSAIPRPTLALHTSSPSEGRGISEHTLNGALAA